jgi:hypothetical protein
VARVRLLKLQLKEYRRFAGEHSLDLNEDVIALVGPNEAGKSSILDALDMLGRGVHPQPSDTTRGHAGPATISPLFMLEADDRALLADIHQGDEVTHLWVDLRAGEESAIWRPVPRPRRDIRPRGRCRELVEKLEGDPALDAQYSENEEFPWEPQLYVDVCAVLASDNETLTDEAIQSLESLANRLRSLRYQTADEGDEAEENDALHDNEHDAVELERAEARNAASSALVDLAGREREATPVRQVLNALDGRTPDVALFAEEDSELQSTYQLAEVAANPPPALRNLCALGEIDLAAVQSDLEEGRVPHIEKVFEHANTLLRDRFKETWTQAEVYPRLSTPLDGVLRILVATEGEEDYSFPEERSDGLRWFMALHAFLVARGAHEPILLVDEAETHLHYDAQADLVDALMSQLIASKVIYTTHSVGCLPPDLGCGIRAVLAEESAERSRVANSYWSVEPSADQRIGYTPLLFAMGARLLSLTIPRYGVIAEGPSDAILMPSLLREAAGLDRLPYRVVPGLAELADDQVATLEHHAGRVVCLTDGDEAGAAIRRKLSGGGIPAETVLHLGQVAEGCTLEDLVRAEVLAEAVNTELDAWSLGPFRVAPNDLPSTGRWAWLEEECAKSATPISSLSKPRVGQRVVDYGRNSDEGEAPTSRLDPNYQASLGQLHDLIVAALDIPTPE